MKIEIEKLVLGDIKQSSAITIYDHQGKMIVRDFSDLHDLCLLAFAILGIVAGNPKATWENNDDKRT